MHTLRAVLTQVTAFVEERRLCGIHQTQQCSNLAQWLLTKFTRPGLSRSRRLALLLLRLLNILVCCAAAGELREHGKNMHTPGPPG